jgi:hypothetical protein
MSDVTEAKVLAKTSRQLLEQAKTAIDQAKKSQGQDKAALEGKARVLLDQARRIANTVSSAKK